MSVPAASSRSLFTTSQAAQLKQRIEEDYSHSVVLFMQGRYQEACIAAVNFIDATQSLPVRTNVGMLRIDGKMHACVCVCLCVCVHLCYDITDESTLERLLWLCV
jgi:hypothetical protein